MNILLAAVLFAGGLMIGLPTDVSEGVDERAVLVSPPSVVVEEVVKGSPAELAGVQFGDKVSAIDGQEMKSAADFIDYVSRHPDQELNLTVDRGGSEVDLPPAKPIVLAGGGDMPRLGVRLGDAAIVRYPWYLAIPKGFAAAGIGLVNIYISFYLLLKNLILGNGLIFDVSGPVGIASVVGASARLGLSYLIQVTAMISLSLAAINILPIPALDGGRALFVIIEKIFRRPVPMRYEQLAHTIGFVLLIILIVVVTWRDVAGLVR